MSNLGQHNGDGIRYAMHLSAPKGGTAQMLRDPSGDWVSWEDYARLKHVVNYWKVEAETDNARWLRVLEENARLKAEVERLTKADDFIVIQRSSVVSIQEVFGPEDGPDSECKWRYFIRVDKAQYDKVLKNMEEFWSAKEGKQP